MARSVKTDFFQNMYFLVTVSDDLGNSYLERNRADTDTKSSGFQSCTIPSISNDPVEYREGTFIYTRKFPGIPSMDQITLNRGVSHKDSSFYDWLRIVNEGTGNYRADVAIKHYHRAVSLTRPRVTSADPHNFTTASNLTSINPDALPGRTYHVGQAFPSMVKLGGDLDGTSSDISIQEIQLEYEYCEVEEGDFV